MAVLARLAVYVTQKVETEVRRRPCPDPHARARARGAVRRARTPTRDGVTVLQVPFENDDGFDRRVDDLRVAIALTPEQHRCTSESEAWAEVAREHWRW